MAFPVGQVAHPEGQNEEENKFEEENLIKIRGKNEESGTLAHLGL